MATYQRAWRGVALLTLTAGVWAAISAWSLGGVMATGVVVGANAACIRHLIRGDDDALRWPEAVQTGVAAGAVGLGACGLISWLGLRGLFVVTLLTLVSPTVVSAVVSRTRRRPRAPLAGHRPDPAAAVRDSHLEAPWMTRPTTSMDDASLCCAWRVSFVALRRPQSPSSRLLIVDRRREFLDELERRHARGFQAWLASGARAASDPTRYIAPVQHDANRHEPR